MLLPWEEIRELSEAGNTVGKKCRNHDCSWQNMPLVLKVMQESTPQEIYPWIRSQWLPPSGSSNRDLVFRAECDTLTPGYLPCREVKFLQSNSALAMRIAFPSCWI